MIEVKTSGNNLNLIASLAISETWLSVTRFANLANPKGELARLPARQATKARWSEATATGARPIDAHDS
jgi:hypothetical protein